MPVKTSTFDAEGFGTAAAWIDLLNSEHRDGLGALTDHLEEATWIDDYLKRWGLAPPTSANRLKGKFLHLRGALRARLERWIERRRLDTEFAAFLDAAIAAPSRQRLRPSGHDYTIEVQPLSPGWGWIQWQILLPLAQSLCSPTAAERIKLCPNPLCRWVFRDSTRANSRVWCRDARCGNRERVRRSRAARPS
jgi:predicted RNA-binding Zn ribbon-like protein